MDSEARRGDLRDLEACIPALRRYARILLKSRQDADDLVHDGLVLALGRLHTLQDESRMRPWLFAIIHNLFVSRMRRRQRQGETVPIDLIDEEKMSITAVQEDGLRQRDVMRELAKLPEDQRLVIVLVSVEDLSYAEVGQVLGIPIGTVMSRLSRGRERLRQAMDGEERPTLRRVK